MAADSPSQTDRLYEVVLLGASGYTGRLAAKHIARTFPTNLRWALAGRSRSKLDSLATECQNLDSDRLQPAIEVCDLNDQEVSQLARKTKALITCIGPYSLHGSIAFSACANAGTHYLDVTGEVPFVARMLSEYEATAKRTGALMFPQIGIESSPADLMTWLMAKKAKQELGGAKLGETIVSVHRLSLRPSGGTIASVLAFTEQFSIKEINASFREYALSPTPGPQNKSARFSLSCILGVRRHPVLGILSTSFFGTTDRSIVHRTWGLLGGNEGYGPNFHFEEYMRTKSWFRGVMWHFLCAAFVMGLVSSWFRWSVRKLVYSPGEGPTEDEYKQHKLEYRGIALPDIKDSPQVNSRTEGEGKRLYCAFAFQGSLYELTGILVSEAALSILRDDHQLQGGIMTPAMLGQPYIDRLQKAGIQIETRILNS